MRELTVKAFSKAFGVSISCTEQAQLPKTLNLGVSIYQTQWTNVSSVNY